MDHARPRTGWVGWIVFAGVMLLVVGAMQALYGLVAIVNDEWVVWGNTGAVLIDVTAWGWVHLVIGALVVLVGLGVLVGNIVARAFGVGIAAISMLGAFFTIPLYPVWSIVVIALDALVIYALLAHGSEMRSEPGAMT